MHVVETEVFVSQRVSKTSNNGYLSSTMLCVEIHDPDTIEFSNQLGKSKSLGLNYQEV